MKYRTRFEYGRQSSGHAIRFLTAPKGVAASLELRNGKESDIVAMPISGMMELKRHIETFLDLTKQAEKERFHASAILYDCSLDTGYQNQGEPFEEGLQFKIQGSDIGVFLEEGSVYELLAVLEDIIGQ